MAKQHPSTIFLGGVRRAGVGSHPIDLGADPLYVFLMDGNVDGQAVWTDLGGGSGLDHLSMLSAIETVSQARLPGMSSVTTRIRNYSFHAWWLTIYKREIRDTSPTSLRQHMRLGQRIYALAAAKAGGDIGVEGSQKAKSALDGAQDVFPVGEDTIATAGAFGNIYRNPMVQLGLIAENQHGLPIPTKAGEALAEAYATAIGKDAIAAFRSAARTGQLPRNDLGRLTIMAPNSLDMESVEADLLRDLLLGTEGRIEMLLDRHTNVQETLAHAGERRETIRALVDVAASRSAGPVSSDMLRWRWMEEPSGGAHETARRKWQAFFGGDIIRSAYETLLICAQRHLETEGDLPVPALLADLTKDLPTVPLGEWLEHLADVGDVPLRDLHATACRDGATVAEILALVAWQRVFWRNRREELLLAFPPEPGQQTILSELDWLEERRDLPTGEALRELLKERVILRHLFVAARKFRGQRNYTNIIEVEDARLRAVCSFGPAFSGPRIGTAIRYLHDLGILQNGTVTKRGQALLEGAL